MKVEVVILGKDYAMSDGQYVGVGKEKFPSVSVIVPVYNCEAFVGNCIQSLLNQDYPKDRYEVIFVDNASKDGTANIIKHYPVKYVLEDKVLNSYGARNAGARIATGEVLAFCDADQKAAADWLREIVRPLESGYVAVVGRMIGEVGGDSVVAEWCAADLTIDLGEKTREARVAATCNVLYKRDVFESLGGFEVESPSGADFDMSLRVQKATGKKLAYAHNAIQYHCPIRLSVRRLLRREARTAYGAEWFGTQHPEMALSLGNILFAPIKALCFCMGAILRAPFKGEFWCHPIKKVERILLTMACIFANSYGRLLFRVKSGPGRSW